MKKFKALLAVSLVVGLVATGCGRKMDVSDHLKDKDDSSNQQEVDNGVDAGNDIDNNVDSDADTNANATGSNAAEDGYKVSAGSDARSAYQEVIKNMAAYIETQPRLTKDYVTRDYMYYDYDGDGERELVLYLEANVDDVYYRDVCFLDYNVETSTVYTRAINLDELNDNSFYADYKGKMARYSWTTDPMESYIYYVEATDESFSYILDQGFDEIISDLESVDLKPLPLYGDWEIILPE